MESLRSDTPRPFRYLDLITGTFVAVLIISNVASSAKIVDLGFSLFGIPMAFDGGTLLFPLSYIFGDILTEIYGFKNSRRVIWTGFGCLALSALVFFALDSLPADKVWEGYAGTATYRAILGGMSSGGLVVASLSAYLLGELTNALVLDRIKARMGRRFLWVRTISSTLIGQVVDTGIFTLVATAFGVFSWDLFWSLVIANYLYKCGIEILFTPLTYAAVGFLRRSEAPELETAPAVVAGD